MDLNIERYLRFCRYLARSYDYASAGYLFSPLCDYEGLDRALQAGTLRYAFEEEVARVEAACGPLPAGGP